MNVLNLINCWNKIWDKLCWVGSVVAPVYYDKTARESTGSHGWVSPYKKWNLAGHLVLARCLRHTCNARRKLHEATQRISPAQVPSLYCVQPNDEVSFFIFFFFFFKRKLISLLSKKNKQKKTCLPLLLMTGWCSTWHCSDYFFFCCLNYVI